MCLLASLPNTKITAQLLFYPIRDPYITEIEVGVVVPCGFQCIAQKSNQVLCVPTCTSGWVTN
ncbi:hypothetical protein PI124_g24394 [Phytophthora idaei]|nr:hypothetical protein PI125_g26592 [Phytophthora idaei]KAG3230508.1 hypothetical protein PI124_g24394 [Phytophthora idaei]